MKIILTIITLTVITMAMLFMHSAINSITVWNERVYSVYNSQR
jgi:hypothetical protein